MTMDFKHSLVYMESTLLNFPLYGLPDEYMPVRLTMINGMKDTWRRWCHSVTTVAHDEIHTTKSFKVVDGDIKEDDLIKLSRSIEVTRKINPHNAFRHMLNQMIPQLPATLPTATKGAVFCTETFLELWWQYLLKGWHDGFVEHLKGIISKKFKSKMALGQGFYNFTDKEFDEKTLAMLRKGKKYVPHGRSTLEENRSQLVQYMWEFTAWASKTFHNVSISISKGQKELDEVLKRLSSTSEPTMAKFWKVLAYDFHDCMDKIKNDCDLLSDEDINPFVDILDLANTLRPHGTIFAHADKHFGLVLLPIDVLLKAEGDMMNSMGAIASDLDEKEILRRINEEERMLRCHTSNDLTKILKGFPPIPASKQEIPFLKMNPKIAKLSQDQINAKDKSGLKFRPVADSKFYATRPASQALASLLVQLKKRVIEKFPVMAKFYPLSGYEVAKALRSTRFPNTKPYSLIISCDLSDAYSNCSLDDMITASRFLSRVVGNSAEVQTMIEQLGSFVLSNNFIESGTKLFWYEPILPMGNCLSGDALDVIAMAGELPTIVNPLIEQKIISLRPEQVLERRTDLNLVSYERYRDDTKILICCDDPLEIIQTMKAVATQVFPSKIPVSFEYAMFYLSFLDCCFFPNYSGGGFSTFPRLNFSRPSILVHATSNTWPTQLLRTHIGNMIRYDRLCSENTLNTLIWELLEEELSLSGNKNEMISKARLLGSMAILKAQSKEADAIERHCYDYQEDNIHEEEKLEEVIFPPALPYDAHTNVTVLLQKIVRNGRDAIPTKDFMGPGVRPNMVLGNILVQKRKYREIISEHISNDV